MNKKYLYKKVQDFPLYRSKFVILLTNSPKKLRKYIPSWDRDYVYAHSYFHPYKDNTAIYVILNNFNAQREITHGCITHEVVHAANMLMRDRGCEPENFNDEPQAYLCEWIADQIYEFCRDNQLEISYEKA